MIINKLANIINLFIISLYNKDIHFYQILIGLFIFNFIIYSLCKLIKMAKYNRFGGY